MTMHFYHLLVELFQLVHFKAKCTCHL